ncbi:hypothetical protein FRC09_002553 [Ceratobasidium sp. 395]|nr:hypothetical protein FRC09_002553 [Ceratobasidium sp. 395]
MTGPVNNQPFASQRDDSGINDLPGYEDLRAQVLRVRALARSEPESDEDEDLSEDGLDDDLEDNAGYAQGREDDVAEDGGHQDNTDKDDTDEDDSDEDEDASAIAQRDTGMNAILNDPRYARIRELFLNPTMDNFEYGRASLMRMVMEPDEEEWGDVALGRVPKKRLSYKITCAIKATNWFERSLEWRNGDFRAFYRVSKSTFWEIVKLVENHEKFQRKGKGRRPRPVHYQVGVFLLRYGCAGSGARVPMLLTSIGEGTVLLYCRRVIAAIRTFGLTCVGWPTPERKRVISVAFQKKCGLNGAVGALDGVHFKLSHKPVVEGDIYMNYKGALSITVQATCDHEGRFTSFQSGLPGSRPDASVWTNSELYKRRNQIFQPGEYLFADGGYPISPFVVIPFN